MKNYIAKSEGGYFYSREEFYEMCVRACQVKVDVATSQPPTGECVMNVQAWIRKNLSILFIWSAAVWVVPRWRHRQLAQRSHAAGRVSSCRAMDARCSSRQMHDVLSSLMWSLGERIPCTEKLKMLFSKNRESIYHLWGPARLTYLKNVDRLYLISSVCSYSRCWRFGSVMKFGVRGKVRCSFHQEVPCRNENAKEKSQWNDMQWKRPWETNFMR